MKTFLDYGEVELIDHDNDDLTIVNAARVSNDKRVDTLVTKYSSEAEKAERKAQGMGMDDGLMNYLAKHGHFSPATHARHTFVVTITDWGRFAQWLTDPVAAGVRIHKLNDSEAWLSASAYNWLANIPPVSLSSQCTIVNWFRENLPCAYHAWWQSGGTGHGYIRRPTVHGIPDRLKHVTFRIKAPIFVLRQLMRSNVGITWNEVSRRYVDTIPEVFKPEMWRARPDQNIKQGSGGFVAYNEGGYTNTTCGGLTLPIRDRAVEEYIRRIDAGVAPELARVDLPLGMYSTVWMTAMLESLKRIIDLRSVETAGNHPQLEIQLLTQALKAEWAENV